jgi:hypothetical protein
MIRIAIIVTLISAGCSTGRAYRIKHPPRNQQTAEERIAAHRAADPLLRAEDNEARWGTAQAQQRKQERKRQAARKKSSEGPGDVTKTKTK